jgi:sulfide:quinone oxidoreductase
MAPRSTTVIVGAGVGGIIVARRLRKLLPSEHRILVVDRRPEVSYSPSHTWVVIGTRRPEQITRRLSGLTRFGLEFRCAEVVALDPTERTVGVAGDRVRADALVLAPGAQLVPDGPPGVGGVAHQFYDLDAAVRLHAALRALKGGRVLVAIAAPPYRCPAAPHEATLMIHGLLSRRLGKGKASVSIVSPEPQPMPVAGPAVGEAVKGLYQQRGITARFGVKPVRIHSHVSTPAGSPPSQPIAGELELADGSREAFDLLVLIPPHAAPSFLRASGVLAENGWVSVDRRNLRTRFDAVWALGDVTHIPLKNGGMLPKAGVFAEGEAEVVARDVAARLLGRGEPGAFDGRGACYLGVSGGVAAFAEGEFFAEPDPQVALEQPSRRRHWDKVLSEWRWKRAWY